MNYLLYFFTIFALFSLLTSFNAQTSRTPYSVFSPDKKYEANIYQPQPNGPWKVALVREEELLWKIENFEPNGDPTSTFLSPEGHTFLQLSPYLPEIKTVVARTWTQGRLVWEYQLKDLLIAEKDCMKVATRFTWYGSAQATSQGSLTLSLHSGRKLVFNLHSGIPQLSTLEQLFSVAYETYDITKLNQSGSVKVKDLLNEESQMSSGYLKALQANLPKALQETTFDPPDSNAGKLQEKEFFDGKVEILHPDTLSLLVMRFYQEHFDLNALKSLEMRFFYSYKQEENYYLVRVSPHLPPSIPFQSVINPKFKPGVDKEKVCTHLKVTPEGKIFGIFWNKEKEKAREKTKETETETKEEK
jgi:hypothetical protein